jgi:FG-GAP-like repeat
MTNSLVGPAMTVWMEMMVLTHSNGGSGNDTIDGGTGVDLTEYQGIARTSMNVSSFVSNGQLITRIVSELSRQETDLLISIENLTVSGRVFAVTGIQQNDVSNVDGGRFDDIVLRNLTTRQIAFADMTSVGVGVITGAFGTVPAGRVARSTGDVTGDGRADLFLQDTATGSTYFVNIASGTPVLGTVTTNVTADWVMIDQGDVTGDGTIDVLLRNRATGFMVYADMGTGGVFERWVNAINVGTTDWRTIGFGDFDRDGVSDIAIQNTTNGLTYFANFDAGGTQNGWGYIAGGLGTTWIGKASGDFNGDGFDEMIFQHSGNGSVWFVNIASGGLTGQWGVIANNLAGWNVAAVADYDNDGWDDVLMQNAVTGITLIANMDNGAFMGWQTGTSAGTDWVVV